MITLEHCTMMTMEHYNMMTMEYCTMMEHYKMMTMDYCAMMTNTMECDKKTQSVGIAEKNEDLEKCLTEK